MTIEILHINGQQIAEIRSEKVLIHETQDALDIMANSVYRGSVNLILYEHNLTPAFFDLKTGIAGDILQKFSNYNIRLAIIGDFSNTSSKSLKDFIYESNKLGRINFVSSREKAIECLI